MKCKTGYNIEKAEKIKKVIEEQNIGQVHIHQFDCISCAFPACMETKTPYIAFVHTGIPGTYDWFEECYKTYNAIFEIYFNMAEKIIGITKSAIEENKNRYNIKDDNKYMVMNNSIKFNEKMLNNKNIPTKVEKFILVSRLAEEKRNSIKNGISIFKKFNEINPNASLAIVGDGALEKEVLEDISDIKNSKYLGARNDIINLISEYDVVIGLDRCILEAVSTKRLAIISGYENIAGIVNKENIELASSENFSGRKVESKTIDEVVSDLCNLTTEDIKNIVTNNFDFAYEKLNCKKNVYALSEKKDFSSDSILWYRNMKKISQETARYKVENKQIWKDKLYFQEQSKNKDNEIKGLNEEISRLKNENERLLNIQKELIEKTQGNWLKRALRKIYKKLKEMLKKKKG